MLFGTSKGQILVNDVHGELVTQVSVIKDTPIIAMAWSCEKFKMEESELDGQQANPSENQTAHGVILAVAFESGIIYLMKNYDDLNPIVLHTGLKGNVPLFFLLPCRPRGIYPLRAGAFHVWTSHDCLPKNSYLSCPSIRHQTRMVEQWRDACSCGSSRRNVLHFV